MKLIDRGSSLCLYFAANLRRSFLKPVFEPKGSGSPFFPASEIQRQNRPERDQIFSFCSLQRGNAGLGKGRHHLTGSFAHHKVTLPAGVLSASGPLPVENSGSENNEFGIHSRNVFVLLPLQCAAGVCLGLNSEAISEPRRPTRQLAWWVFYFRGQPEGAPVAKWLTRGSAKPVFAGSIPARCSRSQQHWSCSQSAAICITQVEPQRERGRGK